MSFLERIYYSVFAIFYRIFEKIRPSTLKHYYQRAKRGYSYQDCMEINTYLLRIIPAMLGELKNNLTVESKNHILLDPEYAECLTLDIETNKLFLENKEKEKKWLTILKVIQAGFKIEQQIDDRLVFDPSSEEQRKEIEKYLENNKEHTKGSFIISEEEKRLRELAWKYFREYIHYLWY